jgi:hypothetical protein
LADSLIFRIEIRHSWVPMLYQSVGSSACANFAAANLLHLYDRPCGRDEAIQFFGYSSIETKTAVSHSKLLRLVASQLCCDSLQWKRYAHFSFAPLAHELKRLLCRGTPALLTFHMQHRKKDWFGVHCVVVISVDDLGIHIIDSLGRRDGRAPNATITSNESALGWRVLGAPLVVTRRPAYILDGLPYLRKHLGMQK